MADKRNLVPGTWSPSYTSARDHGTNELLVSQGNYADALADPTSTAMRSARNGDPVALPYPEAHIWSRIGSRGFRTLQPTVLLHGGFAIVTADGAFIQV